MVDLHIPWFFFEASDITNAHALAAVICLFVDGVQRLLGLRLPSRLLVRHRLRRLILLVGRGPRRRADLSGSGGIRRRRGAPDSREPRHRLDLAVVVVANPVAVRRVAADDCAAVPARAALEARLDLVAPPERDEGLLLDARGRQVAVAAPDRPLKPEVSRRGARADR